MKTIYEFIPVVLFLAACIMSALGNIEMAIFECLAAIYMRLSA